MNHLDTQRLTRASLELSSRRSRWRQALGFLALGILPLLAVSAALYVRDLGVAPFAGLRSATALADENAMLRAELERARTELDMDKATHAELNRQASALNSQIQELTNRLEFLTARENPAGSSP